MGLLITVVLSIALLLLLYTLSTYAESAVHAAETSFYARKDES